MQLNRRTDYALRTLLYLAALGTEQLATLDEISNKFHIARDHLIKIVGKLAKLNFIVATRGKGGGLRLNPSALKVSLYEIVNQFETSLQVIDCDTPPCPIRNICRLSTILREASQAFIDVLMDYTLADLLPTFNPDRFAIFKQLSIPIRVER
ncbi:MAG: Rrf2 family transcriptional regulator [Legionellales bacterium]|nr:Rrf2 family transcriptional regulator [Legionellales bacterium]